MKIHFLYRDEQGRICASFTTPNDPFFTMDSVILGGAKCAPVMWVYTPNICGGLPCRFRLSIAQREAICKLVASGDPHMDLDAPLT